MEKIKIEDIAGPSSSKNNKKDQNSEKYVFYRKRAIKKTAPKIRHTKTSVIRILNAHPLLHEKLDKELLKKENSVVPNGKTNAISSLTNGRKRRGSIISGNVINRKLVNTRKSKSLQSLVDFENKKIFSSTPYKSGKD